ncbi:unnamed protein product [Caenorhabditis auriculariae]|uniref:Methyltransferase type 11 domain-containing protein n=1 Tax=Caenorhabditis auriculariae TaxID=2777116 RepID=A0A8S1HRK2_9PELO|nr:unnamed protein product [Caenorhabditis auriculariae]
MISVLSKWFEKVCQLLQILWLWFFDRAILYPLLVYVAPRIGIQFLNLGYWPLKHDAEIHDDVSDDNDEEMINFVRDNCAQEGNEDDSEGRIAHIYLYEKTLSMHNNYPDFDGLDILEVSCGQGSGIKWISKKHRRIGKIIGVDKVPLNKKELYHKGDAQDLPFDDESFDVVINVESSHLYRDCSAFFEECFRVLRPGGQLCWTDIRYPHQIHQVQREAHRAGFRLDKWYDITANVVAGIHRTSRKYDRILHKSPLVVRMFASSIRSTYCAPGTSTYQRLVRRQRIYIAAMWSKPINEIAEEEEE